MKQISKLLLYAVALLVAVVVSLYVLFPADAVKGFITDSVNRPGGDWLVAVNRVKPAFPPALGLQQVDLFYQGQLMVKWDELRIVPRWLTLFGSIPAFRIAGESYSGTLKGVAVFQKAQPPDRSQLALTLTDIHLDNLPALKLLAGLDTGITSGYQVGGKLNADLRHDFITVPAKPTVLDLNLNECRVAWNNPLLPIKHLDFKNIAAQFELKSNRLQVRKFNATGDQAGGTLKGNILLRQPMGRSLLDLTGSIQIHHKLLSRLGRGITALLFPKKSTAKKGTADGMSFKIRGTIQRPAVSWE